MSSLSALFLTSLSPHLHLLPRLAHVALSRVIARLRSQHPPSSASGSRSFWRARTRTFPCPATATSTWTCAVARRGVSGTLEPTRARSKVRATPDEPWRCTLELRVCVCVYITRGYSRNALGTLTARTLENQQRERECVYVEDLHNVWFVVVHLSLSRARGHP